MTIHRLIHSGAFQRKCLFTLKNGEKLTGLLILIEEKCFFIAASQIAEYKRLAKENTGEKLSELRTAFDHESVDICDIIY